jgi:hypothetical protein
MSKESIKARELKRIRLVEKYAEKRAAVKGSRRCMLACKNYQRTLAQYVLETAVNLPVVQVVISVSLEFPV